MLVNMESESITRLLWTGLRKHGCVCISVVRGIRVLQVDTRCDRAGLCDNSLSFLRKAPAKFLSGCSSLQSQGTLLLTSLPAFAGSFLAAILTLNFHFWGLRMLNVFSFVHQPFYFPFENHLFIFLEHSLIVLFYLLVFNFWSSVCIPYVKPLV